MGALVAAAYGMILTMLLSIAMPFFFPSLRFKRD